MHEPFQRTLDTVYCLLQEAQGLTYSGPAGTRALYTLVTMLAKPSLTEAQQRQVAMLLEMHEDCINHNGEVKPLGAKQVYRAH